MFTTYEPVIDIAIRSINDITIFIVVFKSFFIVRPTFFICCDDDIITFIKYKVKGYQMAGSLVIRLPVDYSYIVFCVSSPRQTGS